MRYLKHAGNYYKIIDDQTCIEIERPIVDSDGYGSRGIGIIISEPVECVLKNGSPITAQEFNDALLQTQLELSLKLYPRDYSSEFAPITKRFGHKLPTKVTDLLEQLAEYFDGLADADSEGQNDEMRFHSQIKEILWAASEKEAVS